MRLSSRPIGNSRPRVHQRRETEFTVRVALAHAVHAVAFPEAAVDLRPTEIVRFAQRGNHKGTRNGSPGVIPAGKVPRHLQFDKRVALQEVR